MKATEEPVSDGDVCGNDPHRNQPKGDPAMLYGLAGDVARAASATTEVSPYAVCINFLTFLSAAVGRNAFMEIGNTRHHARLFSLHVGRSSRGRKGDAVSLPKRILKKLEGPIPGTTAINIGVVPFPGQHHFAGLSTREGLALMIHDAFLQGKDEVPEIKDKRLWIVENEFANVLHQGKRDGNTLSAALRDVWDGESIRPATKCARIWASHPHVALSGAITPGELRTLLDQKEMTNGFANRFLIFWAERNRFVAFPKPTPADVLESLVRRTRAVIEFAKGRYPDVQDGLEVGLSAEARQRYGDLYHGELNRCDHGPLVDALLARRAPVLLRLAMLFALSDLKREVAVQHIEAAWSWVCYWTDSVRFIFSDEGEFEAEERRDISEKIVSFIRRRGEVSRTEITAECFAGHTSGEKIDEALAEILAETPPRVEVITGKISKNNKRKKTYKLCELREPRELEGLKPTLGSSPCCELRELATDGQRTLFSSSPSSQGCEVPETLINSSTSPSSPSSQSNNESDLVEVDL